MKTASVLIGTGFLLWLIWQTLTIAGNPRASLELLARERGGEIARDIYRVSEAEVYVHVISYFPTTDLCSLEVRLRCSKKRTRYWVDGRLYGTPKGRPLLWREIGRSHNLPP